MTAAKSPTMLPARLPRERVPQYYRFIAPTHDLLAVIVERTARRAMLDLASVHDGEHVLEVAVGTGLSFKSLVGQNPSGLTVGIDITPAMLTKAKKRMSRKGLDPSTFALRHGDAFDLEFPNDHFDLVVNSYMMDMMSPAEIELVLVEIARVLRPGGRIALLHLSLPRRWYNHLWNALYRVHPFLLGGCRGIVVDGCLDKVGLEVISKRFVSQMTFPSEVLLLRHRT